MWNAASSCATAFSGDGQWNNCQKDDGMEERSMGLQGHGGKEKKDGPRFSLLA